MKKSKVALILGAGIVGGGALVAVPVLATLLSQSNNRNETPATPVLPPVVSVPKDRIRNEVTPAQAQVLIDGINRFAAQAQERLDFVIPTDANLQVRTELKKAIEESKTLTTSIKNVNKFTDVQKALLAAFNSIKDLETYNDKLDELTKQLVVDTTNPSGKYYITDEANLTVGGQKVTVYNDLVKLAANNRALLNNKNTTVEEIKAAIEETEKQTQAADKNYNSIKENWYKVNANVIGALLKATTDESLPEATRNEATEAIDNLNKGLSLKPIITEYNDNVAKNTPNADTIFAEAAAKASESISALEVYTRTKEAASSYLNVLLEEYKNKVNSLPALLQADKNKFIKQMDKLELDENLKDNLEGIYNEAVKENNVRQPLLNKLTNAINAAKAKVAEGGKLYVNPADTDLLKPNTDANAAIKVAEALVDQPLTQESVDDAVKALEGAITTATAEADKLIKDKYIDPAAKTVFSLWKDENFTPVKEDSEFKGLQDAAKSALSTYLNQADVATVKAAVIADTTGTTTAQEEPFATTLVKAYENVNPSQAKANFDALQDAANKYLTRAKQDKAIDEIDKLPNLTDEEKQGYTTELRAVENYLTNNQFDNQINTIVEKAKHKNNTKELAKPLNAAIEKAEALLAPKAPLYLSEGLVKLLSQHPVTRMDAENVITKLREVIKAAKAKLDTLTTNEEFASELKLVDDATKEALNIVNDQYYPAYMLTVPIEAFVQVKKLLENVAKEDSGVTPEKRTQINELINPALLAVYAANGEKATPEAYNTIEKILEVVKKVDFTTKKVSMTDEEIKATIQAFGLPVTDANIAAYKDALQKSSVIEPNEEYKNNVQNVMVKILGLTIDQSYERIYNLRDAYGKAMIIYLQAKVNSEINKLSMPQDWRDKYVNLSNAITQYDLDVYGKTEHDFDVVYKKAKAAEEVYAAKVAYDKAVEYANDEKLTTLYKRDTAAFATLTSKLAEAAQSVAKEEVTKEDYVNAKKTVVDAQKTINTSTLQAVEKSIESQTENITRITKTIEDLEKLIQEDKNPDNKNTDALENAKKSKADLEAGLNIFNEQKATLEEAKTKLEEEATVATTPAPATATSGNGSAESREPQPAAENTAAGSESGGGTNNATTNSTADQSPSSPSVETTTSTTTGTSSEDGSGTAAATPTPAASTDSASSSTASSSSEGEQPAAAAAA